MVVKKKKQESTTTSIMKNKQESTSTSMKQKHKQEDDEDEEQHEPLEHLLAFTPLVSGQYYASTCVCISTKDAEKYRAVWWNGILSLKVCE